MESVALEHYWPKDDKRLKVEWHISKRCNFDCSYCSPYTHDNSSKWRNIDDYKSAVNKLLKSTNKDVWISFTGGEPCMYKDFKELVKHCKDSGVQQLSVCSNGSMKSDYYVELMEYLDNIIISYHFEYEVDAMESIVAIKKYIKDLDKSMHVHVMMLPGHFDLAVLVMKMLKKHDVLFGVRRIRPLYMPDGSIARPYQKGGNLKITPNGPDYSDDSDYYSEEELKLFKGNIHDYI